MTRPSPSIIKAGLFLICLILLSAPLAASANRGNDHLLEIQGWEDSQVLANGISSQSNDITTQDAAWEDTTQSSMRPSGFFDFFDDWFDWFGDAEDAYNESQEQNDETGIPNDPFYWDRYGMNVQDLDSMSVSQFERVLNYTGPWIRFTISTDEVAEENWGYRLEPGLSMIRQASSNLGITPRVVINLGGYSQYSSGDDRLLSSLSWAERADRYESLAYRLTREVQSLGFGDAIIEAWNEPDNTSSSIGIGLDPGSGEFRTNLTMLLNGFSSGVQAAGGTTAFSPFMSLNDSKYDVVRSVWQSTHSGFDYFSAHMYDDEPGSTRYWAEQTRNFTGDRPVIISEHGYQSHLRDTTRYRRQAWALYQGFENNGSSSLQGVMGYVYGSNHQPWVIGDNEDFFWQVTHDSRP